MTRRIAAVLVVALLFNGCSLRSPMKRFGTQEQAGTVHVAVQSIARFDDAYTDQLQPHFDLTSEKALDAISQTQVSEMERLRALLAEFTIAGQKRTVTSEKKTEKGEVTTDTVTEKTDPPDFATVPAAPGAKGISNNAPGITPTERPSLDQSLRYRAAAALIQEIALFNRYVRDAAVSRNAIPYVVRLLVTVNPSARREPYDVYTTVSFFTEGRPDFGGEKDRLFDYSLRAVEGQAKTDAEKAAAQKARNNYSSMIQSFDRAVPSCERAMEIVPLFVTDNLESSLNSSANERIIDVAGGGSGFFANLAARITGRGQAVDRDRSLARGINALTTISRLSSNTLMARLGAANANNEFEMVARTYNVTLLALVPTTKLLRKDDAPWEYDARMWDHLNQLAPCTNFTFTAYSKFRDAVRGTEVPTVFLAQRDRTVADMVKAWQLIDGTTKKELPGATAAMNRLLLLAEMGRDEDFATAATNYAKAGLRSARLDFTDPYVRNMLWHDLVRVSHVSGRSYGRFQLPERTDHFFAEQEVTLFDDGKQTTAILNGARNLTTDGFRGRIHAKKGADEVWLDDTSVKISEDRRRATLVFPSIDARLGKAPYDKVEFETEKQLSDARGDLSTTDVMTAKTVTYRSIAEAKTPKPTKMGLTTDVVKLASNAATFAVTFVSDESEPTPKVRLEITGGTIDTVTPAATFVDGGIEVPGQGNYVITMKNLFDGTPVKLKATRGGKLVDGGERTITLKP